MKKLNKEEFISYFESLEWAKNKNFMVLYNSDEPSLLWPGCPPIGWSNSLGGFSHTIIRPTYIVKVDLYHTVTGTVDNLREFLKDVSGKVHVGSDYAAEVKLYIALGSEFHKEEGFDD